MLYLLLKNFSPIFGLNEQCSILGFGESVCASILAIFLKQTMENSNMSRSNKYNDLLIKIGVVIT